MKQMMIMWMEFFLDPFKEGGRLGKAIYAVMCIISVLLLVEAVLFLSDLEYSQIRRISLEFANSLGSVGYQHSLLLRILGSITIACGALALVVLVRTFIVDFHHHPHVFSTPGEELEKMRMTEERNDRTLH